VFEEANPCLIWMKETTEDQEKLGHFLNANREELSKRLKS
jgi:hypothetical protein